MIEIRSTLQHMNISDTCLTAAVQDVREFIEADGESKYFERTNKLLSEILGMTIGRADVDGQPVGDDHSYMLAIAQAVIEYAIKHDCVIDEPELAIVYAKQRAHKFITNPAHSWMFAKPQSVEVVGEQRQVSADVDVKVAVTSEGKIKKGGKEVLAIALYEKHVLNAATPVDNQGFIAILMKELGMTKAGATTYNYNMKKKFGGTIVAKKKK